MRPRIVLTIPGPFLRRSWDFVLGAPLRLPQRTASDVDCLHALVWPSLPRAGAPTQVGACGRDRTLPQFSSFSSLLTQTGDTPGYGVFTISSPVTHWGSDPLGDTPLLHDPLGEYPLVSHLRRSRWTVLRPSPVILAIWLTLSPRSLSILTVLARSSADAPTRLVFARRMIA